MKVSVRSALCAMICLAAASPAWSHDTTQEPASAVAAMPSVVMRPNTVQMWRDMSADKRQSIVDSWIQLNEVTRPPFPVYRDAILEKWGQKKLNKK